MRTKQIGEGSQVWSLLRWMWVAASVGALVLSMIVFDGGENRDIDIVLAWIMMTLSFPASIACTAVYGLLFVALESFFAVQVGSGRGVMAATWLGLVAAGYFQWSSVLPHLWQKYRRLQLSRKGSVGSD